MKLTGLDRFIESIEKQDGANFLIFVSGVGKDSVSPLLNQIKPLLNQIKEDVIEGAYRESSWCIISADQDFDIEFVELHDTKNEK